MNINPLYSTDSQQYHFSPLNSLCSRNVILDVKNNSKLSFSVITYKISLLVFQWKALKMKQQQEMFSSTVTEFGTDKTKVITKQ